MATRTQRKADARAAREAREREIAAARARRRRRAWLGGVVGAAVAALAVAIALGASTGGAAQTPAGARAAVANVRRLIGGIPESGTALGSASAPVTITEYGDLVCPVCDDFARTSEPALIRSEVRTGNVRLVYRGLETASGIANGSAYTASQVAMRAAGRQDRAWWYLLLAYDEQPQTIGGSPAEESPYLTGSYLRGLAAQVPGLHRGGWSSALSDPALAGAVAADARAAHGAGVLGTPAIIVSGRHGSIFYDRDLSASVSAVPSLATLERLIARVS